MDKEAAVAFIEQVGQQLALSGQQLAPGEEEVLLLALQGLSPSQISNELSGVSNTAVRKRLGEIYSKFNIQGQGPGKFAKLMQRLQSLQATPQQDELVPTNRSTGGINPSKEAEVFQANLQTETQQVIGREQEIQNLERWIFDETCRVAAVWGMAGIGKTTLVALGIWQWQSAGWLDSSTKRQQAFESWIGVKLSSGVLPWRCVESIFATLKIPLPGISNKKNDRDRNQLAIAHLMALLRERRYLIVLDGYEGVFGTQRLGKYEEQFKDYDLLLQQLTTQPHRSCVLITSREKPRSLGVEQAMSVRILRLRGLPHDAAKTLLKKKETFEPVSPSPARLQPFGTALPTAETTAANETAIQDLIELYDGNPLWLKVAATTINESFNGDVIDFLARGKRIYDEQKSVLKSMFSRLDSAQQEVVGWLAINHEPATIETLQADIFDGAHKRDLIYTLRSLERCALVESIAPTADSIAQPASTVIEQSQYALPPLVKDFAASQLIKLMVDEIIPPSWEKEKAEISLEPGNPIEISEGFQHHQADLEHQDHHKHPRTPEQDCFNRYCLVKADSDEYLQQTQKQRFLRPVYEELLGRAGSLAELRRVLEQQLQRRRQHDSGQVGYFAGNIMSLVAELQSANDPIAQESPKIDFSQLPIWQASFRDLQLHRFNFESCAIDRADFLENLGDVFALAFNAPAIAKSRVTRPLEFDGPNLLAAGDSNGRVHLWQMPEGHKLNDWQAHQSWVRSVAFSRDGRWLATGGDDNYLRLWELPSELQIHRQQQRSADLCVSPNLTYQEPSGDWVRAVAFSADSQFVLCSSGSNVEIRHIQQRSRLHKIEPYRTISHAAGASAQQSTVPVRAIALSPDDHWLATGGDDHLIQIWDFRELCNAERLSEEIVPFQSLPKHQGWIRALAFSPKGDRLVSSSDDGTVQVWTIEQEGETTLFLNAGESFKDHCERVRSIAISADGRFVASGGDDRQIRFLDLSQRVPLLPNSPRSPRNQGRIWSVTLAERRGRALLAYGDDAQTIRIQEVTVSSPQQSQTDSSNQNLPTQEPLTQDLVKLSIRPLQTLQGYTNSTRSAVFVPNLKSATERPWIASAGDNHQIQIWEFEAPPSPRKQQFPLASLIGHQGRIWQLAYHPKTRILASASDDRTVRLWNIATQDCLQVLRGHTYWVRTLAFNDTGLLLASAGDDETIRLWDVRSGLCLCTLGRERMIEKWTQQATASAPPVGHHHWIRAVVFSPDGKTLVSGGDGKQVLLWDVASAVREPQRSQFARRLGPPQAHRIRTLAFSPDGQWLASGNDQGEIKIWCYGNSQTLDETTAPVRQLCHWKWGVKAIAFHPKLPYLASVGDDQTLYLWALDSTEDAPVKRLTSPVVEGNGRGFRSVTFNEDGQYLVTGDREAWLEVWQLFETNTSEQLAPKRWGRLMPPRPYDGMDITDVTGIDAVRRSSLKALGAIEKPLFPGSTAF